MTTDSTKSAVVDPSYHWRLIDEHTPLGVKLQLIRREAGVASYGTLASQHVMFWTHWAPLPTFAPEASS